MSGYSGRGDPLNTCTWWQKLILYAALAVFTAFICVSQWLSEAWKWLIGG